MNLDPEPNSSAVTNDPWEELKAFTDARIALGRCGSAVPLGAAMEFKLSHAKARDAVHSPFDAALLERELSALQAVVPLESAAADRTEYLTRPDKGRVLSEASVERVKNLDTPDSGYDLCLIVGDGLSARAVNENASQLLKHFLEEVGRTRLSVAPIFVVENARVAISDQIGSSVGAKCSIILIGERPGLSAPNSMGIYITYDPRPGRTNESRNCISNIRTGGLSAKEGARKLSYLVERMFLLKRSGVTLKDEMAQNYLPFLDLLQLEP